MCVCVCVCVCVRACVCVCVRACVCVCVPLTCLVSLVALLPLQVFDCHVREFDSRAEINECFLIRTIPRKLALFALSCQAIRTVCSACVK